MWISRQRWERLIERVEKLEELERDLRDSPRVYADGGRLHTWSGGEFRLIDAVNQMAEHIGLVWKRQAPVAAKLECLPEGKNDGAP